MRTCIIALMIVVCALIFTTSSEAGNRPIEVQFRGIGEMLPEGDVQLDFQGKDGKNYHTRLAFVKANNTQTGMAILVSWFLTHISVDQPMYITVVHDDNGLKTVTVGIGADKNDLSVILLKDGVVISDGLCEQYPNGDLNDISCEIILSAASLGKKSLKGVYYPQLPMVPWTDWETFNNIK